MTAPFGAWIIAPDGRGTTADVATLRELFAQLHAECRPPDPKWLVHEDGRRVSDTTIQTVFETIATHDGPRLVWIVGDAIQVRHRWHLSTTRTKPTIRIRDIWEDLGRAAKEKPAHPLIAIVDVCHAADGFENLPPNLVAFAACADNEKARADDLGGWLTRQLAAALTTLPGEITAHDLQGYLDQARTREGLGDQRPHVHLGHHTGLVLNRRAGAPAPVAQRTQSQPIIDPITAWKAVMRARHKDLFPIFKAKHVTKEVFVELALAGEQRDARAMELTRRLTLPDLMKRPGGRWAVLGVPGAGKSTLARHLTWTLAGEADGPIAVYLSLPGFISSGEAHFLDYAARILKDSARYRDAAPKLVQALMDAPRLYLLLDGLDEVAGAAVKRVRHLIRTLSADVEQAHIAVFSRVAGFRELPGFETVTVQPLDATRQRRLLEKWLTKDIADAAWAKLQDRPALVELAGTPLLLSLIALLFRNEGNLPPTRVKLYGDALTLLFERGYSATEPQQMPNPTASRRVLQHLSLALQSRGGEAWPFDELGRTLRLLEEGVVEVDQDVLTRWRETHEHLEEVRRDEAGELASQAEVHNPGWWDRVMGWLRRLLGGRPALTHVDHEAVPTNEPPPAAAIPDLAAMHAALHGPKFDELAVTRQAVFDRREEWVEELGRRTGVLAEHDGPGEPWRYLHRALRDALCAEQLARLVERDEAALLEFAKTLGDEDQVGRWAETFAQVCAMVPAPRRLLSALIEATEALGRRTLAEVDGLPIDTLLEMLLKTDGWDGEDLLRIARRVRRAPGPLLKLVTPDAPLETVARVHYALSEAGAEFDNATFFESIGRPQVERPAAARELVELSAGTFQMGGKHRVERPIHPVHLSPFALGRTTVTKAQFAEFDPQHDCPGDSEHPVTAVSWYVARLFCIWAGGRLPTEAEWEYACRAGSTSAYCFGDDPADLKAHGWFHENAPNTDPQPVAQKLPNVWGLYDLHGNVWEWCADWYGDYGAESVQDPTGPASGSSRVVRGGSAWYGAVRCRSAYRVRSWPGHRDHDIGFRLARSAPPQLDSGS